MNAARFRSVLPPLVGVILFQLSAARGAQPYVPTEVGTTVNGFQDDFDGTALGSNWVVSGASVFSVSGSQLHVTTATGDPNHLLYEPPGYDATVQEVLARIRVNNFSSGDAVRGGVAVGVDPSSTQGINYLFRNVNSEGQTGNHLAFLDDLVVWGPGQNFVWQSNVWYWLRLRQEPNAVSQGGANDVFGKIWLADGTVPEPTGWQLAWDYTPAYGTRTGFSGITASSSGGTFEFDVDYILIKAAGLPLITVAPAAFVQTPVAITNQPQSQTVMELSPAAFSVQAVGQPPPAYQWFRDGGALAGATNTVYTLASAAYTDNGAAFRVVAQNTVSNVTHAVTSSVAMLTVMPDTNPPVLVGAQAVGLQQVLVTFSEWVTAATATNVLDYALSSAKGATAILGATLDASQTNALLTVAPLADGTWYTLTVNNVTDCSHAANVIALNSQARFLASLYASWPIGDPTPAGSQAPAGNGYDIAAGGAGVGGKADQFSLSYQVRTGDFDLAVRLASLDLADAWSEAGLMAREDLSTGARFASVLATPSISGSFFTWRAAANGAAARSGSLAVNYPNTWLRLKRAGSTFTGYGSFDGQNWAQLGAANLAFGPSVYFGFVVSSYNTNQVATAAFRDFGPVTSVGSNGVPALQRLGQCSRRTSLVLSEIMYHPTNSSLEFVELFNSRGEPQDLSGYQLAGSISFTFPAGASLPGGGFVVVGNSPAELANAYGLTGAFGPYTNHLPNGSGTVRLLSQAGAVLLEVKYSDQPPWPVAADGAGHSLVLARPSYGEGDARAWAASDQLGGSPGRLDPVTVDPLRNVMINEFLARANAPGGAYVELYNHSPQAVDISGAILTDDPAANEFVIPAGTLLPANGFASYSAAALNFTPNAAGGTIYLINAARTRVLDAARFEGQADGVATGRYPDGGSHFYPLSAATPGAPNAPIRPSDIVINEIMYAPVSLNDDDQYVELYNRGSRAVDLGGWQFVAGISFTVPAGTVVAPDGYLVVARNAARLLTHYPNLNAGNLVGDFGGKLAGGGERLALGRPDTLVSTNALGVVQTSTIRITVNEVTYGTGGRWGEWSKGGGSSLELIDPHADNTLAPNWADSDETHKAPWTIVSATGKIDNGDVAADELQVLLQGVGECLLDDVQVLDAAGNNWIANGTFESNANGWTAEGTEKTSAWETTEGYDSARSYHLRAVEKGDNQVNRVRVPLTTALASGTTNVTIRAAVRWLKGDPEVLLRLRGNWLECAAELPTPTNPGTPGARNSRYVTNAPPAIVAVTHTPVLPAANQPIVVTAQVTDPDGVGPVFLSYRADPNTAYTTLAMTDDGTGGDAVAGDGVYSAAIPGQAAGTMVAFYLQATDGASAPASGRFPNDAPARECLVRVGEVQPTGNYPVYRLWMTQQNYNAWNSNPKLDNSFNDVTFVLGDERVIYNAGARYKGSPYISPGYCGPTCGRCGYSYAFPNDDPVLGENELVIDWPGGHGGETTALQEQMCYWIADRLNLPWSHRHTIRLHINGVTDDARQATFEAVVQPAGGFVSEWSPNDSDGELFKIERAFEFNDADGLVADPEPRLQVYTTTGGVKKREKYRWNFMFRSTDRRDDYTNVLALVDAVNAAAPEPYTSATLGLVDLEEWMGIFAAEHIIENFDAYGHEIGKNMYAYLPLSGKWQLYLFDLDWAMLAAPLYSSSYAASAGPLFNADDPTITRMYGFAPFVRAYWRAVQNAVNGPLNPVNCNPVIEAKSRSLFANGIQWCDGQALTGPAAVETWFSQRRAALQAQLATVSAPFAVKSVVVSNNVAVLTGTAPIGVQTIQFNGGAWPLTWNTVTGWTARVVLQPGTNSLSVAGVDTQGQPIAGAGATATAVYAGTAPSPAGCVIINEIMYNPAIASAEYVELYNNSSTNSFDLSGWQVHGLSYTFPAGSMLGPNGYLVLAANRAAFAAAYGATNLVFDTFAGTLQVEGETLTLAEPGTNGGDGPVVAKVRYSSSPPWPAQANAPGSSLQLIDSGQDNWRVANWAASLGGAAPAFARATPGALNGDAAVLTPFPPLWLNEIQADNLSGLTNRLGQRSGWLELFNPSTNTVALSGLYLSTNYGSLLAWSFPAGATIAPGEFKVLFADGQPGLSSATEWHPSFTLGSGSGALALSRRVNGLPQVLDYLDYTNLTPDHSYGSVPDGQSFDRQEFVRATPGAPNNLTNLPSSIAYFAVGGVYAQDFDALPNPGAASVNTANPVTINGITYSLANPFDFAAPPAATGSSGGLGIAALAGWYGRADLTAKFGATDGDQTTGGDISFGLPGSSNRALGLLATSTTGATAFGAKFVNQTGRTLSYITLRFTGELWRQSDLPKTIEFSYWLDPTAAAPFSASVTAFIGGLNVNFPTSGAAVGGAPADGSAAINQTNLSVFNQQIAAWPPGGALWLTWTMADATGKAQGLAIDNLSFAAADLPMPVVLPSLSVQVSGANVVMNWSSVPGATYQAQYTDDLSSHTWLPLGTALVGTSGTLSVTNALPPVSQRFYRLSVLP